MVVEPQGNKNLKSIVEEQEFIQVIQMLYFFTPIWGRFPFWLVFFRGVETTNQTRFNKNLWFCVTWTHEELPGCFPRLATVPDLPIMWLKSMGIQRPLTCFEDMDRGVIIIYSCINIYIPGWWFQIFFIFTPIWGRFPIWLIFFKWVGSTTNQICVFIVLKEFSLAIVWWNLPSRSFNSGAWFFCQQARRRWTPTNP